jgi:alpha-galactosidase
MVAVCLVACAGEPGGDVRAWARGAILGEDRPATRPAQGIEVRRQDYGKFGVNRSVLDTPLKIGGKSFAHGLGTHAVSEIAVSLPAGAAKFEASVGVDNNYDTAGKHGSVEFIVEAAGKELYRSQVMRGGQEPVAVGVDLGGHREFTLRVSDGGDGPAYDQADWCEAAVTLEDGKVLRLHELPVVAPPAGSRLWPNLPFSFVLGGQESAKLLPAWKRAGEKAVERDGKTIQRTTWTDPASGLEVMCELTLFVDHPAAEWVVRLKNTGTADTPIIDNILSLDMRLTVPEKGTVTLHHANGSTCAATDFVPIDASVAPGAAIALAPGGGRSSDGRLPFFNLAWEGGGLVGAIGWSGQWSLNLNRDGGRNVHLRAGQQTTHLKLHPGESIRTPRILLVSWDGPDRMRGHNLLRRVMLAHYLPRLGGKPVMAPITNNTWFTFNEGNNVNAANQFECIAPMAGLGVEAYWLDAGWFEGGWPAGAGSWTPRKDAFPDGLRPLADAAHKRGMKFVLWFEPERVHPASRIGKEHPEWVLHAGGGDGLFNLGDPKAAAWMADYLSRCVREWGIDVYRNDFNIDPLRFWQAADAPDRKGMAEIRYIEGLYALWDALLERNPGMFIDNCSSGGRRIDLETLSRSVPLWRSDTACCGHAETTQDQNQVAGLSLYVPTFGTGVWGFDPYTWRSAVTTGSSICVDTRKQEFAGELAQQAIAEAKSLRPLYEGDYYPLAGAAIDERQWCGWQFHRPDLGEGFAVFFRRAASPYASFDAALQGLDPQATYEVSFHPGFAVTQKTRMSGSDLARFRVEISERKASLLVRYRKLAK